MDLSYNFNYLSVLNIFFCKKKNIIKFIWKLKKKIYFNLNYFFELIEDFIIIGTSNLRNFWKKY